MKTTHLLALAAVLMVAGASASAGEWGYCGKDGWAGHGHGHWGKEGWGKDGWNPWHEHVGDFTKKHGMKFSHGYFYVGKDQKHFTQKWANPRFKTDFYWCPHTHMPYYWCEGHGVYYPVRYIHTVAPNAKGPGPAIEKPGAAPVAPPPQGPVAPPPQGGAGEKKAAPVDTPKPPSGGGDGGGSVAPPDLTGPNTAGTNTDRLARAQTPAPRVPEGTFDDPIP